MREPRSYGLKKTLPILVAHVTNVKIVQRIRLLSRPRSWRHRGVAIHVDSDGFPDPQEEGARVFQSPLYVGHSELGGSAKRVVRLRHDMNMQLQRMVFAMETKGPIHGDPLAFAEIEIAGDMRGPKADIGISIALKNLLLHFFIPRPIAASAALCVDCNESIRSARRRVQMDRPAFESEGAMSGMEHSLQGPVNRGPRGVERHSEWTVRVAGGQGCPRQESVESF